MSFYLRGTLRWKDWMRNHIKRRQFISLLGGAAAAWPLAARAQPDGRAQRIGMLMAGTENNPAELAGLNGLRESLAKLGWIENKAGLLVVTVNARF